MKLSEQFEVYGSAGDINTVTISIDSDNDLDIAEFISKLGPIQKFLKPLDKAQKNLSSFSKEQIEAFEKKMGASMGSV